MAFDRKEYEKVAGDYAKLRDKGASDLQARRDKNKPFQEMVAMEREAAKEGYNAAGGQILRRKDGEIARGPSKRSVQEEYVRKFEAGAGAGEEPPKVEVGGKLQTLAEFHRQRLGLK